MDERLFNPISTAELERRWAAARREMAERKIDALLMQQNNDWLGGYLRWFTDTNLSNGYPRTVIFPVADLMTVIDMGPFGGRRKLDGADETNPGVGEMIFTPAFTSVAYTDEYQAELTVAELKRRGYRTIGWLGSGAMPHKFVSRVEHELGGRVDLRRCDRVHRPHQGAQERRGDAAHPHGGRNAGRDLHPGVRENPSRDAR